MTDRRSAAIAVIGEALIDVVETDDDAPRLARPGGSPYNVAIGLARLGRDARFVGRLSHDPLGLILRRHAERSGVDLGLAVTAHEPSTVALVELTDGAATYRFGVDGTSDFRWTDAELDALPDDLAAIHFGSLASWLPPGDAVIARHVARARATGTLITYDPNVRPHLQPDPVAARRAVETALPLVHVAKTSDEDVAYLYPGEDPDDVAARWLTLGPALVVITRGGAGSSAHTAALREPVRRPVLPVDVVDTVGAGDAFTTGLLDAMVGAGVLDPAGVATLAGDPTADDAIGGLLEHAARIAGITCARAGANPPRLADLVTV